MEIRQGELADLDSIVALDQVTRFDPERVGFIEAILRTATCLVAHQDGAVVGYAALEYSFYGNGFVSILYVAEPMRRQGIGRSLMKALHAGCTTRKLFTSTNRSNATMQALLESLGYGPSGIIYNLDPGDPELVYFLDLVTEDTAGVRGP